MIDPRMRSDRVRILITVKAPGEEDMEATVLISPSRWPECLPDVGQIIVDALTVAYREYKERPFPQSSSAPV